MVTTERNKIDGPRLFPELEDVDNQILEDLAKVGGGPIIVLYRIHLPPVREGEPARPSNDQAGVYFIRTDSRNNLVVKGMRTEPAEGRASEGVTVRAMRTLWAGLNTGGDLPLRFYRYPGTNAD